MAKHEQEEDLTGRWVRAHEEETDDELVFRRPDHDLPPMRRRDMLQINADRTYLMSTIGRADGNHILKGTWAQQTDAAERALPRPDKERIEIISVTPGRLTIRRPPC